MNGSFIDAVCASIRFIEKDRWNFNPTAKVGDVTRSAILGTVMETDPEHRIMVPAILQDLAAAPAGEYTIEWSRREIEVGNEEKVLTMLQRWPVRRPRPYMTRLRGTTPLITGQRVLDTFFPVSKGGAAGIPGPFGSGKTVTQHSIAKWADAQVIVYIGCGERGNEMTEVLQEFPHLVDPRSGRPLMERTVLIANTSNMPVAA